MRYRFQDLGEIDCRELVKSIATFLVGRRAVNVSFDSGIIQAPGWEIIGGLPVTPTITHDLLARWPVSHDAYCDEWWVFQDAVPDNFHVHPFCNFIGTRIADYKDLDWPGGCPLDAYLAQYEPWLVFGNNERAYLIARV